jgi:hypothetical protein
MAKINFKSQNLLDLSGEAFKKLVVPEEKIECPNCKQEYSKTEPITLAEVVQANLLSEDQKATPLEKFAAFKLASKIKDGEEVDFTIEELALIKTKIGLNPNPVIVGRVFEFLEK